VLRVAAEHADLWNIPGGDTADAAQRSALLDRHITLGLPAQPYPANVARWVADELIAKSQNH
jgi:hypothetical protein